MKKLDQAIIEMKEYHELNHDPSDDDMYTDSDAIEDLMDECGMDSSGLCSLAGTEYCDWECPFNE